MAVLTRWRRSSSFGQTMATTTSAASFACRASPRPSYLYRGMDCLAMTVGASRGLRASEVKRSGRSAAKACSPFWTLTLSEDDHLSVSAVRSGGEGGGAALIPRVRWTSGRHTLFDSSLDGYGDTGTERIDVCGSGWHRYVLTVSSPPAITLHVDGEAGAAVSWRADVSGGLFRRGPSTASLPARGIWLGRAAPTAISKGVFPGEPREATLEMVDLALFIGMGEDASPDALPAQVTFKSWRRPTDRTPNIGQRVGAIGRVTHVRAWHSTWFACVALAVLLLPTSSPRCACVSGARERHAAPGPWRGAGTNETHELEVYIWLLRVIPAVGVSSDRGLIY